MFTALGNIFSVKPRQAEHTDTRQEIQRHDPDFERRRRKKNERPEDEQAQDNALVSVDALKIFLDNFVKNGAELPETLENTQELGDAINDALDYKIQTEMPIEDDTYTRKQSGQAAYAVSAYENMSQANEKSKVLFEATDQSEGPPLDLSAADIRVIHALIEDLKLLGEANIEYLRIERAATFLDSLMSAVGKAKAAIS